MEKKRLLLVGNKVPEDWSFRRGVEAATGKNWELRTAAINRFDGIHRLTRYFTWFLAPFRLFLVRNRYEDILSWEQFLGLILAFYCRIFHVRHYPRITVMALIYRPKKGMVGRIFARFMKYTVSSRYIHRIIVYSRSEVGYYAGLFGVPEDKFAVELLGQDDRRELAEEASGAGGEKYDLSAGRSNRDYGFLRQAWPAGRERLIIVCDVERAEDTPDIHYEKNCHGDDYLRLLAGCHVSVIPLESERFSSGQMVFLQSAMFGKPVIVTRNDTVADYVENGVTGYVIDKTPDALRRALGQMDDPEVYRTMSSNARRVFEERFSLFELGRRVGKRIKG